MYGTQPLGRDADVTHWHANWRKPERLTCKKRKEYITLSTFIVSVLFFVVVIIGRFNAVTIVIIIYSITQFPTRCLKYTSWKGYMSHLFTQITTVCFDKGCDRLTHTVTSDCKRRKQYADNGHDRDSGFNCVAYALVRSGIVSSISGSI